MGNAWTRKEDKRLLDPLLPRINIQNENKIIFKVDEHVFIWNNKTLQEHISEEVARQLLSQSSQEELPDMV